MRIIFKKFRTRMIVGCILAVIALLAVSVVVLSINPASAELLAGNGWRES